MELHVCCRRSSAFCFTYFETLEGVDLLLYSFVTNAILFARLIYFWRHGIFVFKTKLQHTSIRNCMHSNCMGCRRTRIDTENIKLVFCAVKDTIMQTALKEFNLA